MAEITPILPSDSQPNIGDKPKRNTKVFGNRYTTARKLAIRALAESGMTPTQIQRSEGIDRSTVYDVMKDDRYKIFRKEEVDKMKTALIGGNYHISHRAQSAITDEKLTNSSALQLMTIAAIGIDKGRLMENLSTENVAFRGLNQSIDEDRKKIMDRLNNLET